MRETIRASHLSSANRALKVETAKKSTGNRSFGVGHNISNFFALIGRVSRLGGVGHFFSMDIIAPLVSAFASNAIGVPSKNLLTG